MKTHEATGEAPEGEPSEELVAKNREVQRLLGRCLLRLQHAERMLRALVAGHHVYGSGADVTQHRERRAADVAKLGLGELVDELLAKCVQVPTGQRTLEGEAEASPAKKLGRRPNSKSALLIRRQEEAARRAQGNGLPWFITTMTVVRTREEAATAARQLRELVVTRNLIVHRFSDDFEIRSVAGCARAISHLAETEERLLEHLNLLKALVEEMDEMQRAAVTALQGLLRLDGADGPLAPAPVSLVGDARGVVPNQAADSGSSTDAQ